MKFSSLLRASITEGMEIFNMKKGGKGVKIFAASALFIAFFGYANIMLPSLKEYGAETSLLSMFMAVTALLTVIEGVYKSGNLMFNCKDDDMLLSLPITKGKIVALRLLKFYLFELAFNSLFLVPAILAYGLNVPHGLSFWLVSAVVVLLVPILPMALSCIIGALISAFSSRFKKHNLIQTVLAFAALLFIMYFSFKFGRVMDNLGSIGGGIGDTINRIYYPAQVFASLAEQFAWFELVKYILINIAVAIVTILIVSKFYFRINSRVKTVRTASASEKISFGGKTRTPFKALLKKEFNRISSSPVFMTNACFGLVLFLIGVGVICFKFDALAGFLMNPPEGHEEIPLSFETIQNYLPLATFALMAFCSLMSFMTTTMISMEGKAINLTKTLPISARKILSAKVFASLMIVWPPILIGIIVMIIRFQFGILESILLLIAGLALPCITELYGIFVDLRHANFNAENDTEIVKQSTSTMIATFFGLGISMTTIGFTAAIALSIGQTIALVIVDVVLAVVLSIMYLYFSKTCEKKFNQLQS